MQWTTDIMEHIHIDKIKALAHIGINYNYYNQITHHLDRLDKCFRFNLAMYIEEWCHLDPLVFPGIMGRFTSLTVISQTFTYLFRVLPSVTNPL